MNNQELAVVIDKITGSKSSDDGKYALFQTQTSGQTMTLAIPEDQLIHLVTHASNAAGACQKILQRNRELKTIFPVEWWEFGPTPDKQALVLSFRLPGGLEVSFQVHHTQIANMREAPLRLTERQIGKAFAPYALEIGQLTRAWNALHDTLGEIFTQIVSPNNANVSRAIWYSILSDKTQRDILKAAYLAWGAIDAKTHPKALIKSVDNLGFKRNDAIHAPILVGKSMRTGEMFVSSDIFYGNPRAIKLHGKELLLELRWYRMSADVLKRFALSLWFCLKRSDGSWPQRPLLPTLGQTQNHRPSRHKNSSKSRQPLP
jgi:hypothetical protein